MHFSGRIPTHIGGSQFMQNMKSASANWLLPLISSEDKMALQTDSDYPLREFWN